MIFGSTVSRVLPRPVVGAVNRLLHLDELQQLYDDSLTGSGFFRELLAELQIKVNVAARDLTNIPQTGAVIAVSNHPFGMLDAAIVGNLLMGARSDVRILTNRLLSELGELRKVCIFIDPFDDPKSRPANARAMRDCLKHLKQGGLLLIFPAGEVSSFDWSHGEVRDPAWRVTAARLARASGAPVLPIFVRGTNSLPFHLLGMVHSRLRTAALPGELLNKRGKAVEVLVGGVIESRRIAALREDEAAIQYLRLRTDWLARRTAGPPASASSVRQEPVAAVAGRELARCELKGLTPLLETRDFAVYLSAAEQIPVLLNEIGRAREITFRAVGEGTGLARDLDRFDPHYLHLFVWNRERCEIAGAYRIGEVPKLLSRFGREGLYTNSLFKMDDAFLRNLGPSLELGRSFIAPPYQRQFSPLLLLWQGIGKFISQHPEYATLIGAVSVSNQYSAASRELIVRYFDKCTKSDLGTVSARRALPSTGCREWEMQALCSLLSDIDDLSAPIEDMEPDGKGLPVLVRQYARLGGKLLAFTVDPAFGNTLDGFVMVDLRSSNRELLSRYLGREGSAKFLAWHAAENMAKHQASRSESSSREFIYR